MNNPHDYYQPETNTYRFADWCHDNGISPLDIYDFHDHEAVNIAAKMHNHNVAESRWQDAQRYAIVPQKRPAPFVVFALAMLAGLFSTLAPVVALAVL